MTGYEIENARLHLDQYDAATAREDRVERLRLSRVLAAEGRQMLAELERLRKIVNEPKEG